MIISYLNSNDKSWLAKEWLGPGFVSISPLGIIILESYQIYLSKLPRNKEICNTSNVWFNYEDIVINFFIRKQNPRKKFNQNKRK